MIAPATLGVQDYFGPESLVFFNAGDPADLAEKMAFVASDPEGAIRIAELGQQVYMAHTWQQERHTLVNLVAELVAE